MATSPTQLSLKKMRADGFVCQVVEHWNPFARVRQDLFGFIDILCIQDGLVVGVQCTTQSNVKARIKKIRAHKNYAMVRQSGIKIEAHGWKKDGRLWKCMLYGV